MILHIGNTEESTKKLPKLIYKFTKAEKYKVNTQKSIVSTDQQWTTWRGNLKINSIKKAPKRINYLGINLTKEVKDLYTENYKTSLKLNINGKTSHVYTSENSVWVRWQCSPMWPRGLMPALSEPQLVLLQKWTIKFIWKCKRFQIAKILKKKKKRKNKDRRLTFLLLWKLLQKFIIFYFSITVDIKLY